MNEKPLVKASSIAALRAQIQRLKEMKQFTSVAERAYFRAEEPLPF